MREEVTRRRVHYIGISGIGMSALAQIDLLRGRIVSGSDLMPGAMAEKLRAMGATVFVGHDANNVRATKPDVVVFTDAVREDNPEVQEARRRNVPVVRRAEYLGTVMEGFAGPRIAVAGTHGKTTTTAMLAEVLVSAGLDPTVLVGGEYGPFQGNLRLGSGEVFVTEACEAFRSFHALHPDVAIITNVEADHLDCYGTMEGVVEGFVTFVRGVRPEGVVIIGVLSSTEDAVAEAARGCGFRVVRFSLGEDARADVWADDVALERGGASFTLRGRHVPTPGLRAMLHVPGEHNIRNALAAYGAALVMGLDLAAVTGGLARFRGVGRRFEMLGVRSGVQVIDDYAHHPTEIRSTLHATRASYPGRRLVVVFQPHLFSRTRDFLREFAVVLSEADLVILTDIYRAREDPIDGVEITSLAQQCASVAPELQLLVERDKDRIPDILERITRPGDIVLTVGAGDIRQVGEVYLARGA